MSSNNESVQKTITVALVLCLVCAVFVSSAAVILRPAQAVNEKVNMQMNILQAAGLYDPQQSIQKQFQIVTTRLVNLETGEFVTGKIHNRVKGGFAVDINGALAFLPGSQVDLKPIKDISPLLNKPQPMVILKMDKLRGNIVVSRRALLEESRKADRSKLLSDISEGDKLKGLIKNITDYGVFVDLGGMDGLIHVTDLSWEIGRAHV